MGWLPFWGDDPLKEIDPTLRQFLEKESPKIYKAEGDTAPSARASTSEWGVPTFRSLFGFGDNATPERSGSAQQQQGEESARAAEDTIPQESLFKDGRYAHLWKTYRPASEAEEAGKSDQEKLTDIVSAYKERNAELGRAAMENCAMEQMAIHECFSSGSWAARLSMCRAENRELEKCIGMQTKFLRALGYLSLFDRSPEESEKIQMHADKLYHKMLQEEKAIETAKDRDVTNPAPEQAVAVRASGSTDVNAASEPSSTAFSIEGYEYQPKRAPIKFEALPPHLQAKYADERFKDLEGPQLELAKRELEQDLAWKDELLDQFGHRYVEERRERLDRQSRGQERLSDKIKRWFDMRDWSRFDELEAQEKEEQSSRQSSGTR